MGRGNSQRLDRAFHALSDSTRRLILEELGKRDGQTLYELCVRLVGGRNLSISRQGVSKHLNVLEEADLITTSWQGRTKLHTSNLSEVIPLLGKWLDDHGVRK